MRKENPKEPQGIYWKSTQYDNWRRVAKSRRGFASSVSGECLKLLRTLKTDPMECLQQKNVGLRRNFWE